MPMISVETARSVELVDVKFVQNDVVIAAGSCVRREMAGANLF